MPTRKLLKYLLIVQFITTIVLQPLLAFHFSLSTHSEIGKTLSLETIDLDDGDSPDHIDYAVCLLQKQMKHRWVKLFPLFLPRIINSDLRDCRSTSFVSHEPTCVALRLAIIIFPFHDFW